MNLEEDDDILFENLYKELRIRSNIYLHALGIKSNVGLTKKFDNKILLFISEVKKIFSYSLTAISKEFCIQDKKVSTVSSFNTDFHESLTFPVVFSFGDDNKIVLKHRNADTSKFLQTFLLNLFPEEFHYYNNFKYINLNSFSWEIYIKEKKYNEINNNDIYLLGLLSAALYTLRAIDMHDENVLFSIHGPVVVDSETLFHQETYRMTSNESLREIGVAILDSKSNLYNYLKNSNNNQWFSAYISGVKDGFNKIRTQSNLSYKLLSKIPNLKVRYLPRNTQEYFLIAKNMNHSKISKDILLKQKKYKDYLCKTSKNEMIGRKEFIALSDCLIPTFYTYIDTTSLLNFENEEVFCFDQTAKNKLLNRFDKIIYSSDSFIEKIILDIMRG